MKSSFSIHAVGGPTLIIEVGGLRLLTDPTFDPPGSYPLGSRHLTKTEHAAVQAAAVGPIDAVLLSHDQHPDNLDTLGRRFLAGVPAVYSTPTAAGRIPGITGLALWEEVELGRPDDSAVRLTALPAQHGPDGSEHLTGPVTGFLLSGAALPTIYISGDNASLDVVDQVAERCGKIDVAVLFAGAAQTPLLGDAYLTITSAQAAEASRRLGARWAVPAHFNSWAHFTEGGDQIAAAFTAAGLADRLVLLGPGASFCPEGDPYV